MASLAYNASTILSAIVFSLPLVSAAPLAIRDPTAQLLSIMPSSDNCAGAVQTNECVTAAQALGPILTSFSNFKITTAPEQAALLSWIALESGELKYNINHYPGIPGQGTRCMISPTFVKQYVASIPELASSAPSGTDPAALLGLVLPDEYSFASAAWFLSSQCSQQIRTQLQTGSDAGWEAFVTQCVQTTVNDQRRAYWNKAKATLSIP